MLTWISLPGLGLDPFCINRVALSFTLFGKEITVMWYGVLIVLGIFGSFAYACWRGKKVGIGFDTMLDYTLFAVIFGIICARLYYILFYADGDYKTFMDVIAIWNGGLAIYGGIIGGGITVFVISRIKKHKFLALADFIAPAVMIGQIVGRWGNFINGEAHGTVTDLPWRMGIVKSYSTECSGDAFRAFFHPTFIYESLWNLLGFILINVFYKKHRFDGEVFLWYVAWYGLGRGFIEMLRTDSLMIGDLRVSSVLGLASFVIAVFAIIFVPIFLKKRDAASSGEEACGAVAADGVASSVGDVCKGYVAKVGMALSSVIGTVKSRISDGKNEKSADTEKDTESADTTEKEIAHYGEAAEDGADGTNAADTEENRESPEEQNEEQNNDQNNGGNE